MFGVRPFMAAQAASLIRGVLQPHLRGVGVGHQLKPDRPLFVVALTGHSLDTHWTLTGHSLDTHWTLT